MIGSTPTRSTEPQFLHLNEQRAAFFSTGCKAGSLNDDGAFGTPTGLGLDYVVGLNVTNALYPIGRDPSVPAGTLGGNTFLLNLVDPYGGMTQSRDLREIESFSRSEAHTSSLPSL